MEWLSIDQKMSAFDNIIAASLEDIDLVLTFAVRDGDLSELQSNQLYWEAAHRALAKNNVIRYITSYGLDDIPKKFSNGIQGEVSRRASELLRDADLMPDGGVSPRNRIIIVPRAKGIAEMLSIKR